MIKGQVRRARCRARRRNGRLHLCGLLAVLSLAVLAAVFAGCGTSSSQGGGDDGTLRIGVKATDTFDPAKASSAGQANAILYDLVYAPLIHRSPTGEFEPALAESWEYVDGAEEPNTVFEMTLRKDAKFSDGTPVSASAVVKWLNYFVDSPGPFSESFGENPKFEEVSPQIVRITLSSPNPSLPHVLSDAGLNAGSVVSPEGIDNPKKLATVPAGAGPYVLDPSKTVQGSKYVFTRNPDYFEPEAISFEKVELKVIGEATSRLQAQQSGQLDVAEGDAGTIDAAEEAGLEVVSTPQIVSYLALDLIHDPPPAIKDVRVRRAINLAIDRDAIATAIYGNAGSPTSSFLPTDIDTSELRNYWEYNPEKATEELAAAGYPDGFTLKAVAQGAYAGAGGEPLIRAVAKDLEAIGIKLDITIYQDATQYGEAVFAFDGNVSQLGIALEPTPTAYGIFLAPNAVVNFFGDDAEINRLYEKGVRSEDPTPAFTQLWERFTSQAYTVSAVAEKLSYYVSDGISGVVMSEKRPTVLPTEWGAQ